MLLGFCGYGLFQGPHPFSLDWLNPFTIPSGQALAQGLLLSVFCYWGFESTFSVNEEIRDPEDASKAGLITLFTMLGLFLLGSFAFQRVLSQDELVGHGAQGLTFFGDRLAAQPLAALPLVALTFSATASLQSGVIPTVRGMFAMSRDRTLGPLWLKVSPRYGTPVAGHRRDRRRRGGHRRALAGHPQDRRPDPGLRQRHRDRRLPLLRADRPGRGRAASAAR